MCAAFAFVATSCSDDGPLTASAAKSALKDTELFAKNTYVTAFNTGYYEVSESVIEDLEKLQSAGVITYTTDKVTEYRSIRRGNYWYGYYYDEVEEPHTFAQVTLTEAGLKHEVDEPEWAPKYLAKYIKAMKDFEEVVPDYMDATPVEEVVVAEEEVVEAPAEEAYVEEATDYVEEEETPAVEEVAKPAPVNKNQAYENAVAKVNTVTHYMLMGQVKLEKVVMVSCTEDMFKEGKGTCSFVYTVEDKTPFGFVYGHLREGGYEFGNATFKYYNDLGWVVTDIHN